MSLTPGPVLEPWPDLDRRLARRAEGLLADFNTAGVLEAADVHVAQRVGRLGDESDPRVLLAVALAVRGVRSGSVCVDLDAVPDLAPDADLPWPDAAQWRTAVAGSRLVEAGVLRWDAPLLYLDRYHRLEVQVADDLAARVAAAPPEVDEAALASALALVQGAHFSPEQQTAAERAVRQSTTVLTGGPGTGKTTTVARLLVLLAAQARARGQRPTVALAAFTGKAVTRLNEAVATELARMLSADEEDDHARRLAPAELADFTDLVDRASHPDALTLHRLLGWRPDNSTRFRHDRGNRLKYDVVVVDESSMVELTLVARLLESLRPTTRLVLVGDPGQLTSVGAGAVLGDVVRGFEAPGAGLSGSGPSGSGPSGPVASLVVNHRSEQDIQALAEAVRAGDADEAVRLLRRGGPEVDFVEADQPDVAEKALRDDLVDTAIAVREHALAGRATEAIERLDQHRLLCAHREGPFGVRHWNRLVERWLAERTGQPVTGEWYVGRPLLITGNDYALDVYNGETGVAVADADGRLRAWVSGSASLRDLAPARLDAVETMHAMTIHKSQGSQAQRVTVLLPEEASRLLTRELLYTAITRAEKHVRVVGTEAAVRAAVQRRAQRATGLAERLRELTAGPGQSPETV
ncbi:exodeoxyribonuclease V subunit alpha [Nocardioides marinquilinus]|uniref:RecBCD enzyme subunit RecD n=1 Tax=Nocardioides marinquilinus TaxID=1210400 RepID=A0ABP9Q6Q5_9ACTN